jgi:hypothetical protein
MTSERPFPCHTGSVSDSPELRRQRSSPRWARTTSGRSREGSRSKSLALTIGGLIGVGPAVVCNATPWRPNRSCRNLRALSRLAALFSTVKPQTTRVAGISPWRPLPIAASRRTIYLMVYSVGGSHGYRNGACAARPAASSFLAGKHQLLIDGKWVDAKSGKKFDVFDPATGQAIAAVAEADAADVDEAVKAARRAFESGPWARTSPADRCKLIWKLADLLESHADEIAELEALDNGKPIRDARNVDLPGSYEILRYMAGWAPRSTARRSRSRRPATGTPTPCGSRSVSLARSSHGISR